MAQTRRRRQTKHRGNAAGAVETRGRTGRPLTAAEKTAKGQEGMTAREKRLARYDKPPTWRAAINRAMIAAVLMLFVSLLLVKNKTTAIALFPIVLLLYVPVGFYTDRYLYKRRQRQKAAVAKVSR
jgi:hypothetical protein